MKHKILGLLAVGLLAGPGLANATPISFTTDTASDLVGTFSIDPMTQRTDVPTTFRLLPGGVTCSALTSVRDDDRLFFGATCIGTPDTPGAIFDLPASAQSFASISGMFDNNTVGSPPGTLPVPVFFLFSNLQDTGGAEGVFSGSFCFSARENRCSTSVPEPGTLALLGLGLLGLGLTRRRAN